MPPKTCFVVFLLLKKIDQIRFNQLYFGIYIIITVVNLLLR